MNLHKLHMFIFCVNLSILIQEAYAGLHGNILDLAARLDIAIDVAHAITYLHMYTGFLFSTSKLQLGSVESMVVFIVLGSE